MSVPHSAFDVIGDIHGESHKLEALLNAMGYVARGSTYRPPHGRKAIFLGDLIDRGAGQIRVLEIARGMVEAGDAMCIMGNHEFNAIAYVTEDPRRPGECYRINRGESRKARQNRQQHAEFLAQVVDGSPTHRSWVQWFRTLPVYLDLKGMRAVHGCWDDRAVASLADVGWMPGAKLSDELLAAVHEQHADGAESDLMRARKLLTCGMEIDLPPGKAIAKDGHTFDNLRIANWRHWASNLKDVALVPKGQESVLDGLDLPADLTLMRVEGAPVFIGHHWFSGQPAIESPKLACLDWSAAKNGPLVAYRWDGEQELSNDKLIWVGGQLPLRGRE